jgi:hypothetical protein
MKQMLVFPDAWQRAHHSPDLQLHAAAANGNVGEPSNHDAFPIPMPMLIKSVPVLVCQASSSMRSCTASPLTAS